MFNRAIAALIKPPIAPPTTGIILTSEGEFPQIIVNRTMKTDKAISYHLDAGII